MLNILVFLSVMVVVFTAKTANAKLLHFDCTGIKKNGEPCNNTEKISDDEGHITTCTRCGAKYTFTDGEVRDEYGNVINTW